MGLTTVPTKKQIEASRRRNRERGVTEAEMREMKEPAKAADLLKDPRYRPNQRGRRLT